MFRPLYLFFFKLLGWKVSGPLPPDLKKYIIAVAPHTSNWDFVVGVAARSILKIQKARFLGKSSLFKPPTGWFFRFLGGYPVDRAKHSDMVEQVVNIFRKEDHFILALAPEGTRKKVDTLRTGFYYIAKKAGVPIVPVGFDYRKREVVVGRPFYPSEDVQQDIRSLTEFYAAITGKNPELGIN